MRRELVISSFIKTTIVNETAVRSKILKIANESRKNIKRTLDTIGKEMQRFIRQSMRDTPKAAYSYKRGKKKHYPSLPYNFPAIDSGNLWRNITYHSTDNELKVGDLKKTPYAVFLEMGTAKMNPRPFIEPTWRKYKSIIEFKVMQAIQDSINR